MQKGRPITLYESTYVNPDKGPFATFCFKYRSLGALRQAYCFQTTNEDELAALKSLLIIPRSPSPVPLLERNVDTLSLEETRELLRRRVSQRQVKEHDF
jgi:hypothetical protein